MTDNVYNREDVLEKYREAGRILKIVRTEAADMIKVGNSLLEVAEFVRKENHRTGRQACISLQYLKKPGGCPCNPKSRRQGRLWKRYGEAGSRSPC